MNPKITNQIVSIKVEKECIKSLPCQHLCKIEYKTGEVATKIIYRNVINDIANAIPRESFIGDLDHFQSR